MSALAPSRTCSFLALLEGDPAVPLRLALDGDRIRLTGHVVTDEIRDFIRQHRGQIVRELREREAAKMADPSRARATPTWRNR